MTRSRNNDEDFVRLLLVAHVKKSAVKIEPDFASKSARVGDKMFHGRTTAEAVRLAMEWCDEQNE